MISDVFPEKFINNITEVLGCDTDRLLISLETSPCVSVRYNRLKSRDIPDLSGIVPWCESGRYLNERPYFTSDPCFQSGRYYVQEASSMFVCYLLQAVLGKEIYGMKLLDLCAAPGGKTTIYADLVGREGLVVANEVVRKRSMILSDNVVRWGTGNVVVTNNDPSHFESLDGWFDVVAVDAPCSGEGMFRKDVCARDQWSEDNVRMCAARQRRILADIWPAVKSGGLLIYSTCTFNRIENEENVEWLSRTFDCEPVSVELPQEWGIVRSDVRGIDCFRFFPHLVRGEGFFVTIVRKNDVNKSSGAFKPRKTPFLDLDKKQMKELCNWLAVDYDMEFKRVGDNIYGYNAVVFGDIKSVCEQLSVIYSGVCMGQIFGDKLRPDHSLALFYGVEKSSCVDVDLETARNYLARRDISASFFSDGINLLSYESLPIGWVKRIGNRINTFLPKQFAINNLQES